MQPSTTHRRGKSSERSRNDDCADDGEIGVVGLALYGAWRIFSKDCNHAPAGEGGFSCSVVPPVPPRRRM